MKPAEHSAKSRAKRVSSRRAPVAEQAPEGARGGATTVSKGPGAGRPRATTKQDATLPFGERERIVDEMFATIPAASGTNGHAGAGEIIRKNRRARARQRILDAFEARGPYPIPAALLNEARTLVERWSQKEFVDAFPEADTFEERCAQEREVLDAAARGDEEERFAAAERAYRQEVVRRHGFIEIRGLQLSARVFQELDMVYVPLHVEDRSKPSADAKRTKSNPRMAEHPRSRESTRTGAPKFDEIEPAARKKAAPAKTATSKAAAKNGATRPPSQAKANQVPKRKLSAGNPDIETMAALLRELDRPRVPAARALGQHERLYLFGGPGSGKSTLMAYLAVRAARGDLHEETGWDADPVPFLIPARAFREEQVTTSDLARAAGAETWFFEHALSQRTALLLVDGLDEAKPEIASLLLRRVTELLDTHSGSRAVVSARPAGRPSEDEPVPPGFASVRLTPMTPEEVGSFVDRWCLAAEVSLGKSRSVAESDARAAAEDLKERIRARGAIEKLAQTPLLCSVICIVHRFLGQRIPSRRVALYEAITNVLLYEWDRAKFPDTPNSPLARLDAQAKRALLSRLARAMHEEQAVEWPADRVIASFAKQLPDLGRAAGDAPDLVAHIRDRHGVLVERSPGMFAFSHLTFQEYLTAMEMAGRREYPLLLQRYEDSWWHEVIVLTAGFPGAEVDKLVRGLVEADKGAVARGTMLAAQCLETAIEVPVDLRNAVEKQVGTLVPPATLAVFGALVELGDVGGPVLLDRLKTADADGMAAIAIALGCIGYEPAAEALGRLLADTSVVTRPIPLSQTNYVVGGNNVADCASIGVAYLVLRSENVLPRLFRAIPNANQYAVGLWRTVVESDMPPEIRARFRALLQRYEEAHPIAASAALPKRAARSG